MFHTMTISSTCPEDKLTKSLSNKKICIGSIVSLPCPTFLFLKSVVLVNAVDFIFKPLISQYLQFFQFWLFLFNFSHVGTIICILL